VVARPWTINPDNTSTFVIIPNASVLDTTIQSLPGGIGTALGGGSSAINPQTNLGSVDLTNQYITLLSGTGAGQSRRIIGYSSGFNILSVSPNWTVNPDGTSVYVIHSNPTANLTTGGYVTANTVNDKTGYQISVGTGTGQLDLNNGQVKVQYGTSGGQINLSAGNLVGPVASVTGAVGSVTGAVGSVTGAVGSVTAAVTVGSFSANAITSSALASNALTAIAGSIMADTTKRINVDGSGNTLSNLSAINSDTTAAAQAALYFNAAFRVGTVSSASTTSVLSNRTEADGWWNAGAIAFITGALAGITRKTNAYLHAGGAFTVDPLPAAPANGDKFILLGHFQ
jgi:hypothetical protein